MGKCLPLSWLCADDEAPNGFARDLALRRLVRRVKPHCGPSPVIRKYLDRVVEATHRMFADAFEIEIVLDEIGERA